MRSKEIAELDALIAEITVDAYNEEEQLWAFRQVIEDEIAVPCNAHVAGQRAQVLEFDYDGNHRRGLTATCLRPGGKRYEIAACDVVFPENAKASRYIAAYRKWMGLVPFPGSANANSTVELAVLSVQQKSALCCALGSTERIILRAIRPFDVVPGETAVVNMSKRWSYRGHVSISGPIESTRLEVKALGLAPLRLMPMGAWDPAEQYWGEAGEPVESWTKPIIARGPRPQFEMEQILPGEDREDPFSDPIIESNDHKDAGDIAGARKILMDLCEADLRCLDAHAHLGNLAFDARPDVALRHYEVGFRIGELTLGEGFDGVLPWGCIDNRPFLRCMNSFGLCLWRLRRFQEAAAIFDQMLWLNPSDNQGVRGLIAYVHAKEPWRDFG